MRPNLITRLKEEWNNLDPVDPLRGLIADAIDALAEDFSGTEQPKLSDYEPDGMHHNKPQKRPQNCGTGYCSCIECLFEQPAQQQEPVAGVVIREGLPTLLQDRHIKPTDQRLYTSPRPAQQQTDERIDALRTLDYCHGLKAGWNFCAADDDAGFERAMAGTSEAVRILKEQPAQQQEPFGYFRAEPFGWTNCTATDEGAIALYERPPASKPWVGLTDRENAVIRFALHRFMADAYAQMTAAAQDKDNRYFKPGAVDAFAKDAKDAESLLAKLREKNA